MKTETFNALLSRLKRDTSDTDLSLGMRAKRQNYELDVYCEDGGEMQVECTDNGNVINLTMEAIERIQVIFDEELDEVERNHKYEETRNNDDTPYYGDDYESTGHKPSDFY